MNKDTIEIHILSYKPDETKLFRCLDSFNTRQIPYVLYKTEDKIGIARNYAYQNCKSEYCSYVDDDDTILVTSKGLRKLLSVYTNQPIFTNSELAIGDRVIKLLNDNTINFWSLDKELLGEINTHQLTIFKTSFIQKLSKLTLDFMVKQNIDLNLFDYFIRIFVSLSVGWNYQTMVSYRYDVELGFSCKQRATKEISNSLTLRHFYNTEVPDWLKPTN
jgi:glycosyltransferase involved in cell wall biosynthesis